MTRPRTAATTSVVQQAAEPSEDPLLERVRRILAEHDHRGDPATILARAVMLARRDADNAQHQAGRAGSVTARMITSLQAILGLGGPAVAFLLQQDLHVPPISRVALAAFALVCAATYLYTCWTSRPRLPREPGPDSSGWYGVVGIPKQQRSPQRLLSHYVLRAVDPVTAYARDAADNGDVAHHKHRRNQRSGVGITASVLLGVLCVALLLLRW